MAQQQPSAPAKNTRLNNNHVSSVGSQLMTEEPDDFAGFFETRTAERWRASAAPRCEAPMITHGHTVGGNSPTFNTWANDSAMLQRKARQVC